ncbi:nucleotidyltransferase domain-containing protein [Cryobacterium sp. SO1]|uniref:nucleotidyltransferase domain-containing protein n=1 Tax=Cryobacterium sp. SO1 TaxID=1897061 RepID=UPI001023E4ED|nr:nucleotidyltransferase domain-containing protein [Cryobacterium sp. SO1]
MTFVVEYREARRHEDDARLRRVIALRAMLATGLSQQQVGDALGISQPAVSQQLRNSPDLEAVSPADLLAAAAPVLKTLAEQNGYQRLAVFGSVARGESRHDSDIDLLVDAGPGASSFEFVRFKLLIERVLGREIDLISYGGLTPGIDEDIRRDAVLL